MGNRSELITSIHTGDIKLVKSLIEGGTDINSVDNYNRTPLYEAILVGSIDIVEVLCFANTNINHQDKYGKTPLHFASIHNQFEIARLLIKYNADVNVKDINGNTPIFDAIFNSHGNPKIIVLLKENNADYKTPNYHGVSPKDLAETIGNFDVSYIFY
jgi:ankyrin repeat protein